MSIQKEPFGTAEKYTVSQGDLAVSVLTYGATVQSICYRGVERTLGYHTLEEYQTLGGCLGATVGRYANRIAAGKFTLNGKEYDVGCNEAGRGHLHGGKIGMHMKMWQAEAVDDHTLRMRHTLEDGEEGYPGKMEIAVLFTVEQDALKITYQAVSDRDTVFNPTNHAYFNLGSPSAEEHLLRVEADHYTPVDELLIPTGELRPVAGTPFDFTAEKPIGKEIDAADEQLAIGGGYDHNFAVRGSGLRLAATAFSPESGVGMECYTDMPGVQLYTGNFLEPPFRKRQGFCLETQFYPDSPNHPAFPSAALRAGERFMSVTEYRFFTAEKK